jgi:hypothetical protein
VLIHGGAGLGSGGESTSIFIQCINVIMVSQMAQRLIMNVRTEIQGIRYAELSKIDSADEQIHVYLLSRLVGHIKTYFLHQ